MISGRFRTGPGCRYPAGAAAPRLNPEMSGVVIRVDKEDDRLDGAGEGIVHDLAAAPIASYGRSMKSLLVWNARSRDGVSDRCRLGLVGC